MNDMTDSEERYFEHFWETLKNENLTETEYLERILGPKHLPSRLVIPLTMAYVTIFVSGAVGNVGTCIVIIKNSSMHTATNYYLFSLAISDLILLLLGLPNELSSIWQQYPWALGVGICKMRAYVSEMSSYVSVLTIVAFSMERYLAICHPLRAHTMSGLKRPIMIILAAWSIAIFSALPFAIFTKVNYVEYPPDSGNNSADSAICAMLQPDMPHFPLYEISCVVFFLIPMLFILVVYVRMGLKIRDSARNKSNPGGQTSAHWDSRQVKSRKSIIKMLSAVVVMFFFCWAPFHAQRLFYVYGQEADFYPDLNEWLYILSGSLYYFSTTVNPILYNIMSLRYRKAFKLTICCGKEKVNKKILNEAPCRCGLERRIHTPSFRCSVKQTIDHAKEMLKVSASRQEIQRDIEGTNNLPGDIHGSDENCNAKLLPDQHLRAQQQISGSSTTSGITIKKSSSTTSSLV